MDLENKAIFRALQQIHINSKFGIFGHFIVLVLTSLTLYNKIPITVFILGILLHIVILFGRIRLYKKFDLLQYKIILVEDLMLWVGKYKKYMFFSGLAFGLIIPALNTSDMAIHFFVIAITVGMAAGAIYTIGELHSVYRNYLLGIFAPSFIWMISVSHENHIINILFMIVASGYFLMTSFRYSKNFEKIFSEKEKTKEQLNKILEQKNILDRQAHYDDLTKLPNKLFFQDRLAQCLDKSKRNNKVLAVCFINLDNFKIINETLGHDYGDRVLVDVASRLKDVIRAHDVLARWAGDEFVLIVDDLKDENDASIFAQKILNSLHDPFLLDMDTFYITSSIGISLYPRDATDSAHLIKYADSAMYKAKTENKNNFKFYSDDMTKVAFERVVMEASLRAAIDKEEFIVYYQPQIDAKNNKLIGMEALVRWEHPSAGIVPPYKFIPLAEETGLIIGVDTIVMRKAMKQFAIWYADGYKPGILSLNLATKNLEEDDYLEKLKDNINQYCLDSSCLELELLESDIMKNPLEAIKKLKRISELGVKIAIDDFGTGYSSLAYLKKFPLNKLKIDKSFVDDIPHDEDGKAIVKAIIALGKSLKLKLIAEGVETEAQRDFLIDHGCDNIQGYLYAKPMPAEEMELFMKQMKENNE